jgi:hypothetical protein
MKEEGRRKKEEVATIGRFKSETNCRHFQINI